MKKAVTLFLLASAIVMLAQEVTTITVKESSTTTGVVIVSADMSGKTVELQCNVTSPSCSALKPGKYQLVQLPKNHGMYDCQNADVYESAANPASDQRLGEYCLSVK